MCVQPGYDFTGSLMGTCDVSFEEGPLAILASELAAPDFNTSDYTLDDPLSAGRRNISVLGTQVYEFQTAQRMLVFGEDPFRRSPVVALLPAVRLDVPHNRRLFQATLCEVGACPRSRWLLSVSIRIRVVWCGVM